MHRLPKGMHGIWRHEVDIRAAHYHAEDDEGTLETAVDPVKQLARLHAMGRGIPAHLCAAAVQEALKDAAFAEALANSLLVHEV
jgi:hypothetical protein